MIGWSNTASIDEVERLALSEREAERRYYEALDNSDLSAAREAAADLTRAADALATYLLQNIDIPCSETG